MRCHENTLANYTITIVKLDQLIPESAMRNLATGSQSVSLQTDKSQYAPFLEEPGLHFDLC